MDNKYINFIHKVWLTSLKTEKYMKNNIILLLNNKLSLKQIQEINNKLYEKYFLFTRFSFDK